MRHAESSASRTGRAKAKRTFRFAVIGAGCLLLLAGCGAPDRDAASADLILDNAVVHTLAGADPGDTGVNAIAIRGSRIIALGSAVAATRTAATRVIDLGGATVLPGLIESHTHVFNLGKKLERVDLTGIATEAEAVDLVAARAASTPPGEWVVGQGWDEGAWANRYPDATLLSERVPDHPVLMQSLHGFAAWGNDLALSRAGVAAETPDPVGGEILRDARGEPTGLFLNRATVLLRNAVPADSDADVRRQLLLALETMLRDGYVAIHDAGVNSQQMRVLEALEAEGALPLRVYPMLSLRDESLIEDWLERGPDDDAASMLVTRSVKAYYDGALGSRGARLLADYFDRPGHRGISGDSYAYNAELAARVMDAGFQIAIHAIGDAGNRETLDFIARHQADERGRHRIEHAQVVHPDDFARFAELGVIASMQPPHAVEDMVWAEQRLGATRIRGAYAWRSLLDAGARVIFNADNPGSDHSIFYGLHAAVTRRNKAREPTGGWYAEEALNMIETLQAYTSWGAYASFREAETGTLEVGKWADITVLDIDPIELAASDPDALLDGRVLMTLVGGDIRYDGR
ncbi:MAG: amidohydrolase [Pseudomonadota bacterium]